MSASSSPRDIIIVDNEESPRIIKFRQIVDNKHNQHQKQSLN